MSSAAASLVSSRASSPRRAKQRRSVGGDGGGVGRAHVLLRAGERVRATRSALIDEHEVAVLADVREHLVDLDRGVARRAARPALEVEERAAGGLPRGRDDLDVQRRSAARRAAPASAGTGSSYSARPRDRRACRAGSEPRGGSSRGRGRRADGSAATISASAGQRERDAPPAGAPRARRARRRSARARDPAGPCHRACSRPARA